MGHAEVPDGSAQPAQRLPGRATHAMRGMCKPSLIHYSLGSSGPGGSIHYTSLAATLALLLHSAASCPGRLGG